MFSSLRSRLWLSYALLTGLVLMMVALGVLLFLIPRRYRQVVDRLQILSQALNLRSEAAGGFTTGEWRSVGEQADATWKVRVAVIDPQGNTLFDSRSKASAPLPPLPLLTGNRPVNRWMFRDARGRTWLYASSQTIGGDWVVTAQPRPRLAVISQILKDDLIQPFFQAWGIALLLSLVLAFWIARWVAAPLQQMAGSARRMAGGEYQPIPIQGPREVQGLAQAFNEMAHQVQASQQSQRDFVANVSHELKTPLTSIQGFAQAILDGAAHTPAELHQAAGVIYEEASRMHRLVLDLLELARLDAGTAGLKHTSVDLGKLLKSTAENFTPLARQSQVEIQLEINPLPPVDGDPDRLVQVFNNLVDNAIKHSPEGGRIRLEARRVGGEIEVSVADSGPGIPAEELPRLFERFYQMDKSRRGGAGRGVGLGLSIAREIVEAHGGTITAQSTPGKGSLFVVKLPI